jgi:uncharacterized membrane protein HdeD (DUF308 family)
MFENISSFFQDLQVLRYVEYSLILVLGIVLVVRYIFNKTSRNFFTALIWLIVSLYIGSKLAQMAIRNDYEGLYTTLAVFALLLIMRLGSRLLKWYDKKVDAYFEKRQDRESAN